MHVQQFQVEDARFDPDHGPMMKHQQARRFGAKSFAMEIHQVHIDAIKRAIDGHHDLQQQFALFVPFVGDVGFGEEEIYFFGVIFKLLRDLVVVPKFVRVLPWEIVVEEAVVSVHDIDGLEQ